MTAGAVCSGRDPVLEQVWEKLGYRWRVRLSFGKVGAAMQLGDRPGGSCPITMSHLGFCSGYSPAVAFHCCEQIRRSGGLCASGRRACVTPAIRATLVRLDGHRLSMAVAVDA